MLHEGNKTSLVTKIHISLWIHYVISLHYLIMLSQSFMEASNRKWSPSNITQILALIVPMLHFYQNMKRER